MKLGIDIRALQDTHLTGVGRYLAGVLDGFAKIADGKPESSYVLLGVGRKRSLYAEQLIHESPLAFSYTKLGLPSKVLTMLWLLGSGPAFQNVSTGITHLWMPNIGVYPIKRSLPYTVTIHDLSFVHHPQWYSWTRRAWHRMARVRLLLTRAQNIVCVSDATAETLIERFGKSVEHKLHVIPPALPHSMTREGAPGMSLPSSYIAYVGTIEPRKNVAAVLTAFTSLAAQFPDLHLVIVGGYGWRSRLIARKLRSTPRVHWITSADDAVKMQVISRARALVWPSFYEGFGFPPLEALAQHIPVITSYRTSLPAVLRGHAVYCNPYNQADITAALQAVLTARDLPSVLTHMPDYYRGRTWEHVAAEYLSIVS